MSVATKDTHLDTGTGETTLKRKSETQGPENETDLITCCKSKKCMIKKVNRDVVAQLQEKLKQAQSINDETAYAYLRGFITQNSVLKQNGKRRNLTFRYRVPIGSGTTEVTMDTVEICQQGFLQIFGITERYMRNARDGLKTEAKKDPSKTDVIVIADSNEKNEFQETDVAIVKIVKKPRGSDCDCFDSSPVVLHRSPTDSSKKPITYTDLEGLKSLTDWEKYSIDGKTLAALFDEGYNSLISIQSISSSDIQDLVKEKIIKRGQSSVLRRFIGSLNCKQHPFQIKNIQQVQQVPPAPMVPRLVYPSPASIRYNIPVTPYINTNNAVQMLIPVRPPNALTDTRVSSCNTWNEASQTLAPGLSPGTTSISHDQGTTQTYSNNQPPSSVTWEFLPQMTKPIMSTHSSSSVAFKDTNKGIAKENTDGNQTVSETDVILPEGTQRTGESFEIPRVDSQRSASNSSATSIPVSQILESIQSPAPDVSQIDAFVHSNLKTPPTMASRPPSIGSTPPSKSSNLLANSTSPFRVSSASPVGVAAIFKTPSPPVESVSEAASQNDRVNGNSTVV